MTNKVMQGRTNFHTKRAFSTFSLQIPLKYAPEKYNQETHALHIHLGLTCIRLCSPHCRQVNTTIITVPGVGTVIQQVKSLSTTPASHVGASSCPDCTSDLAPGNGLAKSANGPVAEGPAIQVEHLDEAPSLLLSLQPPGESTRG